MDISRTDEYTEIMWWPNEVVVACHTEVETDDLLKALWVAVQDRAVS